MSGFNMNGVLVALRNETAFCIVAHLTEEYVSVIPLLHTLTIRGNALSEGMTNRFRSCSLRFRINFLCINFLRGCSFHLINVYHTRESIC